MMLFPIDLMANIRFISLAVLLALTASAQGPPAPDTLISPEVHPDHRVTFRLRAPKASEVTFFGDWMAIGTNEKMTKSADGIWSVTLGPIPASTYIYSFTMDGVTMADPVNPRIKLRARTSASLLEVPSDPPALPEARDVPHGAVEINWEKSKVLNGETRSMWIYTPPGYAKESSRRYPVLYLFHGSNDTAAGWTTVGGANFIFDNLIAEKKAVPMIVVMPFGHAVPFGSPREVQAKNTTRFEEYIFKDVMPLVESKYRVAPGSKARAIAGLSMGGSQSLYIGFGHTDLFSAIGAFSSAPSADFETRFAAAINDPKTTNARVKTVWIGCGKQDPVFGRAQKFSEMLTAHKIPNTFRATEGAHTFTVWRQCLGEFAPLLFR
jgi:enterochelin esterase family protein